jgi:hypothetical protein
VTPNLVIPKLDMIPKEIQKTNGIQLYLCSFSILNLKFSVVKGARFFFPFPLEPNTISTGLNMI